MNPSPKRLTAVAVLRPWPFGPPLRGRAPRGEAGLLAAICRGTSFRHAGPHSGHTRVQALAPAGGLARPHRAC